MKCFTGHRVENSKSSSLFYVNASADDAAVDQLQLFGSVEAAVNCSVSVYLFLAFER